MLKNLPVDFQILSCYIDFFLAKGLLHIQNQFGRQYQNSCWAGSWWDLAARVGGWISGGWQLLCGLVYLT